MAAAVRPWARDLLHVWFQRLTPGDWYRTDDEVDAFLRDRFEHVLHALGARPPAEFLRDPRTARAAILLFDQVPRNLYRESAEAFAWDGKARALTQAFLGQGWLEGMSRPARQFVLMPLMHSEAIADQELSVALFARHAPGSLSFARNHRRMIARFGRFPHRNEALGRKSSAGERRAVAAGFSW